jgi:hypothetical protein
LSARNRTVSPISELRGFRPTLIAHRLPTDSWLISATKQRL